MNEELEEEYLEDESYYTDDKLDEIRLKDEEAELFNHTYKIVKSEDNKIVFQSLEDSNIFLEIGIKYITYYKEVKNGKRN